MRPTLVLAISAMVSAGACSPATDTSPTLAAPLEPNPAAIAPAPYILNNGTEWPDLISIGFERPALR